MHKLTSSQTLVFVCFFSTLFILFYKMLFKNRLVFSSFENFFVSIIKTREEYGFLYNPQVERTVNSIEQKT